MLMTLTELNNEMPKYLMPSQLDCIDWSHIPEAGKTAALNRASRQFNRLMYIGIKADDEQDDSWPRLIGGNEYELPDDIKEAMCQFIFDYIRINNDSTFESIRSGITSEKIGPVSVSYDKSILDISVESAKYQAYLEDWIYRGASGYRGE